MADFKETQRAFAAHIRDPEKYPMPEGIEDRRMNIYRDLFINSISGLLSNSFPVIRSLYPTEEAWKNFVRTFFKKEHNKTPHFPEIPREFVDFLKHKTPEDKPFLGELAHYEWLELYLEKHHAEFHNNPAIEAQPELLLERVPVISTLAEMHSYQYPVHQIQENMQPAEPLETPIFMLVWRNAESTIKFSQLNIFSAFLFENLQSNQSTSGHVLLSEMAQQAQHADPETFIQHAFNLMLDWYKKGIIVDANELAPS